MKVHFVGIGGIGVSALAQYYLAKGYQVSGSDLAPSEITDFLRKKGAKLFFAQQAKNLKSNTGLVIYSPAVKQGNPELKQARKFGVRCMSYPEALGELTKRYFTIAVSGAHGKSTTVAMVALILIKAGFDPNVIVGTKLKEFGNSNFRLGKSKYLVIEACEYEESFLNYWPEIIVLTNIDKEHLDYFRNLSNILKAFRKFIGHLPKGETLIVNGDDKNIQKILSSNFRVSNYSLNQKKDVRNLIKILKVPGEHNIYNALAALTAARTLKIPDKVSFQALSEYNGVWRRFDVSEVKLLGDKHSKPRKVIVVSDYAHHPTEVRVTLKAAREKFPKKDIWCVFQPHQYQRTYYLFNAFVKTFREAPVDKVIITDIYDVAGRENKEIKNEVSSKKLVRTIKNSNKVIYLSAFKKIISYLKENLKGGEVVIIMGAGDIYKLVSQLKHSGS